MLASKVSSAANMDLLQFASCVCSEDLLTDALTLARRLAAEKNPMALTLGKTTYFH